MSHFIDTNVVAYSLSDDPRKPAAIKVVQGAIVSVQVLNELTHLARRKWKRSWDEIDLMIRQVASSCDLIVPVDEPTHVMGRHLSECHSLSVYDGFIVAAAILADCETLYSEDMHHGLVIEDRLTIINPFV